MTEENKKLVNKYVQAVANGDKSCFDELYNLTFNDLVAKLQKGYDNRQDIEEIVNDVYGIVADKSVYLINFNFCFSWMVRIAKNELKKHIRKNSRRAEIMQAIPLSSYSIFNETKAQILIEIKKLPTPELQLIIIYRYYCKMKIGEISTCLNLSRTTVHRELRSALQILKEKLQ